MSTRKRKHTVRGVGKERIVELWFPPGFRKAFIALARANKGRLGYPEGQYWLLPLVKWMYHFEKALETFDGKIYSFAGSR